LLAFIDFFHPLLEQAIHPFVVPARIKKRDQARPVPAPILYQHTGDTCELIVVVWTAFVLPVVHQQGNIGSALGSAERDCLSPEISHVEFEPRLVGVDFGLLSVISADRCVVLRLVPRWRRGPADFVCGFVGNPLWKAGAGSSSRLRA